MYNSSDPRVTAPEVDDIELVCKEDACPNCGEDRIDWLVWTEDSDHVECLTCGAWYDPLEK